MDNALGKYIAFLDSDDEWLPLHLSECIHILEQENEGVRVCYGLWHLNEEGTITENFYREGNLSFTISELRPLQKDKYLIFNAHLCEYLFIRGFYLFKTSTIVFDSSILKVTGKFDTRLFGAEDVDLFYRMAYHYKVCIVKDFHAISYDGDDNLYFFRNSTKITDINIVRKLNFHRKYAIKGHLKRKNLIKHSNRFINKGLALKNTYGGIYSTYYFLYEINRPFSKAKSWLYLLLSRLYLYRYRSYSGRGNSFFYLSFNSRYTGAISKDALSGIRYRAIISKILNNKRHPSYWLYIEDYVYDFFKKDSLLLYNKANEKALVNKKAGAALNELIQDNKILIRDTDLLNRKIYRLVRSIYKNRMGGLINNNALPGSVPFSVNRNFPADDKSSLHEAIGRIRPEITFYLNDVCDKSCKVCNKACMQVDFCMARQTSCQLSVDVVKKTILDMMKINRPVVNINGGDWMKYSSLKELIDFLMLNSIPVRYYIYYLNLVCVDDSFLQQLDSLYILTSFPIDMKVLKKLMEKLSTFKMKYKIIFLIESVNHSMKVNKLCKDIDENMWDMVPFYNGNNEGFFNRRAFVSKKDILSAINIYDVLIKKSINKNNYGKLYVLPQGDVYTNLNEKEIGNVNSLSITKILESTPVGNTSWKWLRSEVQPCKDCVYDLFCPSITNYEIIMKNHKICKMIDPAKKPGSNNIIRNV